ncbi:hypothetical protein C1Y41_19590 [Pantoea sp. ICBG 1758]|nr:hypothetical protein C1Y41_19590 [Pantoea sp. ICBG 1758]
MRLSAVQKQTLIMLYQFSLNRRHTVPQRTILRIINEQVGTIYPNNFRASCIRLDGHGLVVRESDSSNRKWLTLTEAGIVRSKKLYAALKLED